MVVHVVYFVILFFVCLQSLEGFQDLLLQAIPIVLISYSVTLALAKTFARKHDYVIRANQELLALGLTDMLCSIVSCYPASASPSRSSVQDATGGRTQLAAVFSR